MNGGYSKQTVGAPGFEPGTLALQRHELAGCYKFEISEVTPNATSFDLSLSEHRLSTCCKAFGMD
jgi:hypothetical protein